MSFLGIWSALANKIYTNCTQRACILFKSHIVTFFDSKQLFPLPILVSMGTTKPVLVHYLQTSKPFFFSF